MGDILFVINCFQRGVLIVKLKNRHKKASIILSLHSTASCAIKQNERRQTMTLKEGKAKGLGTIFLFCCDLDQCSRLPAVWRTDDPMTKGHYSIVGQGLHLAGITGEVTVIMQHKEAAGAEVAVELDEDLIGSGGHALLYRTAAELTDLRRGLVGSVPDTERQRQQGM